MTDTLIENLSPESPVTLIDGKPRVTRACPECGKDFQILNKKSKQPICDDCHDRILACFLPLQKKYHELSKKRDELEDIAQKYNGWCNYGNTWPSEKLRNDTCNEWNAIITEQNAIGNKIEKYRQYFELWYKDSLTEKPERCNHEFEHLKLTGAYYENPMSETRTEYWATVVCTKCGEAMNLHSRFY